MRILVSGNAGAGKSSLGKRLAEKYDLSLYGLDKIVWKESWVLEGITRDGLKEADIIYFLDIHPIRCAYNVIVRFLKNGPGSRPELPNDCPEYIGFLKALKINFIFHKVTKPWLLDENLRNPSAKFVQIKNYKELNKINF